jgi:hypothetical protein
MLATRDQIGPKIYGPARGLVNFCVRAGSARAFLSLLVLKLIEGVRPGP